MEKSVLTRLEELYNHAANLDEKVLTFQKAVEGYDDIHETHPTSPKEEIRLTTECAFQRALFNQGKTILKQNESKEYCSWLDYELPVILNSNRRRQSLDLIGRDAKDVFWLCELKFYTKTCKSNSPYYAIAEISKYAWLVCRNQKQLDEKKVHHKGSGFTNFSWQDLANNLKIAVVCNKSYWNYWNKRLGVEHLNDILIKYGDILELFSGEDIDFKAKKSVFETYKPMLPEKYYLECLK